MATTAEIRAWARDQFDGDVPDRGKLPPAIVAAYDAEHGGIDPADELEMVAALDADEADDARHAAALFGEGDSEPTPAAAIPPEVRPVKRPAAKSRQTRTDRLVGRLLDGPAARGSQSKSKTPAKKGAATPRTSLEKLTTRLYKTAGRILAPVSPATSACIQVQSPYAGVILEDALRGTVVDRLMQPLARAEEKADTVLALVLPPVACFGIEMTFMQEQTEAVIFRRMVLTQVLREGLRTGLEVAEKYGAQIEAAMARESKYDADVDAMMAAIFPPPPAPDDTPDSAEMAAAAA